MTLKYKLCRYLGETGVAHTGGHEPEGDSQAYRFHVK